MAHSTLRLLAFGVGAGLAVQAASAQPLNVELVTNGNAESNSTTGWTNVDIEAVSSSLATTDGLPSGISIGKYCFTGGLGPADQSMTQAIDLSASAASIDAGLRVMSFGVLLQSRRAGGTQDRAICRVEWKNGAGGIITALAFEDTDTPEGATTWSAFEDASVVPAGARSVAITARATRDVGSSSDGFFDNISVVLSCATAQVTPPIVQQCHASPITLSVSVIGTGPFSYHWRKNGVPIDPSANSSSVTSTLHLSGVSHADDGAYDCQVTNTCGTVTSSSSMVSICIADFDCSGFVDTDDFTAFVLAFEAGTDDADVDGSGFVDTDDFTAFVLAFEAGC